MPRYCIRHPTDRRPLERSAEADKRLVEHLTFELETGYAARRPQDDVWVEGMRQYAAEPRTPARNQPIPNAPNIEYPLGATIADSLYAQATDTLFNAQPILTCRENDEEWVEHAQAMQLFVNWMAGNEIGLREAVDTAAQDDIQLGTGVLYAPWVEEKRYTGVHKVTSRHPRLLPIAPSDFLVPGGSYGDHQQDPWMSMRFWYTRGELASQAKSQGWSLDGIKPTAAIDQTRAAYERLHRTSSTAGQHERFEVECVWTYFDYFNEGADRDLLVAFDRQTHTILSLGYNRFDLRPVETMRYQIRPHLFYGLGVLEMVQPFQEAATEILNHYLLNMMLANARIWMARHGTVDDFTKVWPSRIIGVESTDDIKALQMADVYPSSLMGLQQVISAAERRVGVSGDINAAGNNQLLGTRTPGITAMTAMQSVNRRFAPAFDGIRLNTAAAVKQCLWRYAERVRMGGAEAAAVENHLTRLLGPRRALRIVQLLKQDDFEKCVAVEFTAVSASINREADRQNALLLMQQLGPYHDRIVQGVTALTQGQGIDPLVPATMRKVLAATNAAMTQFLGTFEQVRNPQRLLVDVDSELGQLESGAAEEQAMQASTLGQVIQGVMGMVAGGEGGAPEGEPAPGDVPPLPGGEG